MLQVFQSFKECLESLEIDYLSTKEKHRNLQLQIYRTGSQVVGEFDIEREVEGHIFRLGMLLEDIQEQMNKSEESEAKVQSSSPTTSGEALVVSHTQESEDVKDLVTHDNTDKVVKCTASETHTQRDSPVVKEAADGLHPPCLHPDTSAGIIGTGLDPALSDHSTGNSINQLTRKKATVISNDIAPLILSGHVCNPKGHTNILDSSSEVQCPKHWILAEHSGFVEERQTAGKLKKNIGECSLYRRYQDDEIRKSPIKLKPRKLSIFVEERTVNPDLANCNKTQDSLNSEWLVSSHSDLFQCRSKSPISDKTDVYEASTSSLWKKHSNGRVPTAERHRILLNPETEYPKKKSLWSSKVPLCVENQSSLSNRLYHIRGNVNHYMPPSRSSEQSSISHHSQLASSTLSTLQGKRWKNVKPNNLDYRDYKILNYVLDNALRTAKNMQKTTERMVQKLAVDLVNPTYCSSYTV